MGRGGFRFEGGRHAARQMLAERRRQTTRRAGVRLDIITTPVVRQSTGPAANDTRPAREGR